MNLKIVLVGLLIMGYGYGQKKVLKSTPITEIQTILNKLKNFEEATIRIPVNKTALKEFKVKQDVSSLPISLQKKFPSIKSFSGKSLDGKSVVTLTCSKDKFFGTVVNETDTYEIQPKGGLLKIKKSDFELEDCADCKKKTCGEEPQTFFQKKSLKKQLAGAKLLAGSGARGDIKSTFTIVITTTGLENERRDITTKEDGLAYINSVLDFVNLYYRREFAIEYELHPENDKVVYLDSSIDPYPEEAIDDSIDAFPIHKSDVFEKFDLTTFDTALLIIPSSVGRGGGGPCGNGRASVASCGCNGLILHELGHHLGGNHSYSHDASNGLASIQGSMVGNNNTYVHSFNFDRMQAVIDGATCAIKVATGNTPPIISENIDGLTIPANTPYVLKAEVTDPDSTANITSTWQCNDVGDTETTSLMYTHKTPGIDENVRYVPDLPNVLEGTMDTHSKLASVTRTITSRIVARDNQLPIGGMSYKEVAINVDATAGPFEVTSQANKIFYTGNDMVEVTWNVANTDNTTINAQTVTISLTTDNGETWTELETSTPNDGSAIVTLPNTPSAGCKFMVAAENNIFYHVNKAYFEIKDANTPDFEMVNNVPLNRVYNINTANFDFDFYPLGGFSNSVDVEIQGLPADVTEDLAESINAQGNYAFTIGNLSNIPPGYHRFSVTLTENGGSISKRKFFVLVNADVGQGMPSKALSVKDRAYYRFGFHRVGPADTNAFTMSLWVKPENFDRYCGVFFFNEKTGINIHTDGGVSYHYEDTDYWRYKTTSRLKVNEWNHIALAVEQSKATIYINGEKNINTKTHLPVKIAQFLSYLGWQNSGRYFTGLIDEVKFFDKTLVETEVRQEMHQTNTVNNPNLILYYQFNEGEETLDVRNQLDALVRNDATTVASTAPVGAASVATLQEQEGALDFSSTDITMELAAPNTDNAITVHKLNLNPNSTEGIDASLERLANNSYWEINKFPTKELGASTLTFAVPEEVTEDLPAIYELYHRAQGSDGTWQLISKATAVNLASGEITFSEIDQTGQFLLFKNENTLLNIADKEFDLVSIYPNPAKQVLYVSMPNRNLKNLERVSIKTVLGSKVLKNIEFKKNTRITIPMDNLAPGIYFVELESKKSKTSIRFIKE